MYFRSPAFVALNFFVLVQSCTLAVDNRLAGAECETDDACSDGDVCNGVETCDVGARRCVAGVPLECADTDACTADACDAELGCTHAFIDVDGDGFSPETCEATGEYADQGGDCDDTNSARAPGAPEQCNSVNDDCDDATDEEVVSIPCYRDRDGDGYPSNVPGDIVMNCACPAGYIPGRTDGLFDCAGRDGTDTTTDFTAYALIHPNGVASAQHFCVEDDTDELVMSIAVEGGGFSCASGTSGPPNRFDYDCDGVNEMTYTVAGSTGCGGLPLCGGAGWTTASPPACGAAASYRSCYAIAINGCTAKTGSRRQTCR